MTIKEENLKLLTLIAEKLEELRDEVVFLGGTTNALLLTDQQVPDIRPTIDVDCIMEADSLRQYHYFTNRLREKGFHEDLNETVICRWFIENVSLDIMPSDKRILGFGSKWAKNAIKHADTITLRKNLTIKVVSAPYFIATKLDAFNDRGNNDFLASRHHHVNRW